MLSKSNIFGLVICGGSSTRMGRDKGMLTYHKIQQRYHLYEMLRSFCCRVFISINPKQADDVIKNYSVMVDLPEYENIGPMAALLTAFEMYPENNFAAIGCDYPFISEKDITDFLKTISVKTEAASFYNVKENLYEPLLAFYSYKSADRLKKFYEEKNYSLQSFLKSVNAEKFISDNDHIQFSSDTPDDYTNAKSILNKLSNQSNRNEE